MTYSSSYSTDKLVRVDGKWIRVSAVEAVARISGGRTGIYLSNGACIPVGDPNGSPSPNEVIDRMFGKEPQ